MNIKYAKFKNMTINKSLVLRVTKKIKAYFEFYLYLSRRLKNQLFIDPSEIRIKPYEGMRVLVPIIETSHYQHHHILGVAKALQLRGADVKIVVCGETLDGCEIKSVLNEDDPDPCWKCRFNAKNILPLYGLHTVSLAEVISPSEANKIHEEAERVIINEEVLDRYNVKLDQSVMDSVTRYYYGAISPNNMQIEKQKIAHASTALLTLEVAYRVDKQWSPNIVLNNMPCYSAWESFYKYYHGNGQRFRTISLTPFDFNKVTFNLLDLFKSDSRYKSFKESRGGIYLSGLESSELNKFLNTRFEGENEIFKKFKYFNKVGSQSIKSRLKFSGEKRNIFLFSNIYWDIGLSENAQLYGDVLSWVLRTIELLADRPEVNLYIKPHPGEVYDSVSSLKGVSEIIHEKYPILPENTKIIEPEWKINTYDLFPLIDVGVIFTGTLGLEMMLENIQVISTGKTAHFGLGFASEPKNEAEYLELLLGQKASPVSNKKDLQLFSYFYFIRSKIPWTFTKKAYGDKFNGFTFNSATKLLPGVDPIIDHLCDCIMDLENTVVEAWPNNLV
jgi:hypothetical protein